MYCDVTVPQLAKQNILEKTETIQNISRTNTDFLFQQQSTVI